MQGLASRKTTKSDGFVHDDDDETKKEAGENEKQ